MGFSKTPYEMQREQQERAIKAQEQAYGRQAAMQAWSSLADMDTVTPTAPLAPTHDWQHSADIGAKRAAAMELQTLEGKQKREQIADKGMQDRISTAYEYKTKAAYKPKGTGGYPNEKLERQIWDVRKTVSSDANQQALNDRHVSFLLDKMRQQGPGGRARAEKIATAIRNESPEMQSPQGWNKQANTENLFRMKTEAMAAAEGIKARTNDEKMQLEADKALLRTFEPGFGKNLNPEDEMAFKDATKRVMSRAQGAPQTSTGRASAPAADLPAKTPAAQPSSQMEIRIINGVKYLRDPATGKIYEG